MCAENRPLARSGDCIDKTKPRQATGPSRQPTRLVRLYGPCLRCHVAAIGLPFRQARIPHDLARIQSTNCTILSQSLPNRAAANASTAVPASSLKSFAEGTYIQICLQNTYPAAQALLLQLGLSGGCVSPGHTKWESNNVAQHEVHAGGSHRIRSLHDDACRGGRAAVSALRVALS